MKNLLYLQGNKWPLWVAAVLLAMITLMSSCYYDKEELLYPGSNAVANCDSVDAKFSADILPLITTKCAISGCHDASASGGVVLQNYFQVSGKKDRINERVVVQKSMPPTGALLPGEIDKIKCWIDGGALNN